MGVIFKTQLGPFVRTLTLYGIPRTPFRESPAAALGSAVFYERPSMQHYDSAGFKQIAIPASAQQREDRTVRPSQQIC